MLEDALFMLAEKAETIEKAANALQCQKVEKEAHGLAFALRVLSEAIEGQHPQPLVVSGPMLKPLELDGVSDDEDTILTDEEKRLMEQRKEGYGW